ncbi:hypothetical protein BX666DRAFT_1989627 [Dichotomocladium elegans]|nr:hypothetical protein BX666DRAFT_1989627 [Dichotomocladium elegans]
MRHSPDIAYPGVRAEPKFLRDPTSLEFISSNLTRLSSYVASNFPKRRTNTFHNDMQPSFLSYQTQHNADTAMVPPSPTPVNQLPLDGVSKSVEEDGLDKVTFAAFQTMDSPRPDAGVSLRTLCLLLGYQDGFQIWDVSNPDNIHEICSIRDEEAFGTVAYLHIIANGRQEIEQEAQGEKDPDTVLAIVSRHGSSDNDMTSDQERRASTSSGESNNTATTLHLYSLRSHQVIKEFENFDEDEDCRVTAIQSNHDCIVVGCTSNSSSSLHVLSRQSLTPLSAPLTDVYHDPVNGPVFTLGARFLAYGTSAPVLNDDLVMGKRKGISSRGLGVLQGDKDVKDIAKDVVSGVKSLSEFGYQTLSNYFSNNQPHKIPSVSAPTPRAISPINGRYDDQRSMNATSSTYSATAGSTGATSGTHNKKQPASGMVIIRDIARLPSTPTRNMSASTVVHFRPHTHPLSCLCFNPAGTLLLSASKQGHTFHIFSIVPSSTVPGNVSHIYTLARGYTDAQVEDCQFSTDSMWCSVSTARGTTHVYAINPYGGEPEISGHVVGKVSNPSTRPFMKHRFRIEKSTSLNSIVRVKQRRAMTTDIPQNEARYQSMNPNQHLQDTKFQQQQQQLPRGRLSSTFLLHTKTPYLVNATTKIIQGSSENGGKALLESTIPFKSFKQQASSVLSSLGTSIGSVTGEQGTNRHNSWTSARDKLADNRLFRFDEETPSIEDDVKYLHDDNVGYQDMYSIHPRGILTLHRCWISRSVVKKRDQTWSVELLVKQEDVAEWSMARTAEWDVVKVPLGRSLTVNDAGSSPPSVGVAVARKKKRRPWLSSAEIMTYLSDGHPLWTSPQFTLQTFTEDPSTLAHKMWVTGEMPAAQPITMRRELPEPYSSRIDRITKTMTHIANQSEENIDDALAELEDNLSNAMQTTFTTPSPTNLISGSYGGSGSSVGYKRHSQPSLAPSWTPSAISFEDAHLISMGSGPSPEDLLTNDPRYAQQLSPHQQRSIAATTPGSFAQLHHSSLIYFDDADEYEATRGGGIEQESVNSIRLDDDGNGELLMDHVFSPDGDNEMAYPSESILAENPELM